jgi:hypothetical protein
LYGSVADDDGTDARFAKLTLSKCLNELNVKAEYSREQCAAANLGIPSFYSTDVCTYCYVRPAMAFLGAASTPDDSSESGDDSDYDFLRTLSDSDSERSDDGSSCDDESSSDDEVDQPQASRWEKDPDNGDYFNLTGAELDEGYSRADLKSTTGGGHLSFAFSIFWNSARCSRSKKRSRRKPRTENSCGKYRSR